MALLVAQPREGGAFLGGTFRPFEMRGLTALWLLLGGLLLKENGGNAFSLKAPTPSQSAPLSFPEKLAVRTPPARDRTASALAAKFPLPWFLRPSYLKKMEKEESMREEEVLEPLKPHSPETPVLRLVSDDPEGDKRLLQTTGVEELTQNQRDDLLWTRLHIFDAEEERPEANSYFSPRNVREYHKYNPYWTPLRGQRRRFCHSHPNIES